MKRKIVQLLILSLSIALTGCRVHIEKECNPLGVINTQDLQLSPGIQTTSNQVTPIIQIDGTPSMQGFVADPASRYIRTLALIDKSTTTAFTNASPSQYYRFGTKRRQLTDVKSIEVAQRSQFYDRSNEDLLDAQLNVAIEPVNENSKDKLSIIVTDLYQKEDEGRKVLDTLKEKYLEQGLAVGILGVKSEFDGIVYDVGRTNQSFEYKSTVNNPKTFQPFYVLVLGTYENVASFFDRVKINSQNEGLNLNDEDFVVFYPQSVSSPLSLNIDANQLNSSNLPGIQKIYGVNNGQVAVSIKDRQRAEVLMLKDKNSQGTRISYEMPYEYLPYLLPMSSIREEVTATRYGVEIRDNIEIKDNVEIKNEIEVKDFLPVDQNPLQFEGKAENNQLAFDIKFDTTAMPRGVYWFEVDLFPEKLQFPNWWSDWNLKENEPFKGGTTSNLLVFLENLAIVNLNLDKKAGIGHFCYLVHKNFDP